MYAKTLSAEMKGRLAPDANLSDLNFLIIQLGIDGFEFKLLAFAFDQFLKIQGMELEVKAGKRRVFFLGEKCDPHANEERTD